MVQEILVLDEKTAAAVHHILLSHQHCQSRRVLLLRRDPAPVHGADVHL